MTVFLDIYSVWKKTGKICDLIVLRLYKKDGQTAQEEVAVCPEGQLMEVASYLSYEMAP
jgi:hypothetical protein